jgi:hypothetical protein
VFAIDAKPTEELRAGQGSNAPSLDIAIQNGTRRDRGSGRRRAKLYRRVEAGQAAHQGERMRFMTLPMPGAGQQELMRAFKLLVRRIRREYGRFDYRHVTERGTQTGVLHLHVLFYGSFIAQGWLSDTWQTLTGYAVVDIRAADAGAAVYLAKTLVGYLAKGDGHSAESAGWSGTRHLRSFDERLLDQLAKAKVSRNESRIRVVARGR